MESIIIVGILIGGTAIAFYVRFFFPGMLKFFFKIVFIALSWIEKIAGKASSCLPKKIRGIAEFLISFFIISSPILLFFTIYFVSSSLQLPIKKDFNETTEVVENKSSEFDRKESKYQKAEGRKNKNSARSEKMACVDGDCFFGKGTYRMEDGVSYNGEFKNGKFDGQGIFIFPDGSKLVGKFEKGIFKNGEPTGGLALSYFVKRNEEIIFQLFNDNANERSTKNYKGAIEIDRQLIEKIDNFIKKVGKLLTQDQIERILLVKQKVKCLSMTDQYSYYFNEGVSLSFENYCGKAVSFEKAYRNLESYNSQCKDKQGYDLRLEKQVWELYLINNRKCR